MISAAEGAIAMVKEKGERERRIQGNEQGHFPKDVG